MFRSGSQRQHAAPNAELLSLRISADHRIDLARTGATSGAGGAFVVASGSQATNGGGLTSIGSCSVRQSIILSNATAEPGLDAGTITVAGPSGTQPVPKVASQPGSYDNPTLPAGFIPSAGGSFVFTGTGGADVGPFTASVSYSNPMIWTNINAISSVSRSQGVTVTWSGGDPTVLSRLPEPRVTPNPFERVLGAGFTCYAQVSAGQFTVPS